MRSQPTTDPKRLAELALFAALETGNVSEGERLLASGVSPDAAQANGDTALILACRHDAPDTRHNMVNLLLRYGVNALSWGNGTALHAAVSHSDADLVTLLLLQGIDVHAVDGLGRTALISAALIGTEQVLDLLIRNGADIDAPDRFGMTALMMAATDMSVSQKRLVMLLKRGANPNLINKNNTALTHAIYMGSVGTIRTLIEYGADPHMELPDGFTALSFAELAQRKRALKVLSTLVGKGSSD